VQHTLQDCVSLGVCIHVTVSSLATASAEHLGRIADLYDQSPLLVALFGPDDVIHYANGAWRTCFQLDDQVVHTWADLMRHCHIHKVGTVINTKDFEGWLRSTRSRRGKLPFRYFEGDVVDGRWFYVTETVDAQGWMLSVAFDITAMRVGERNLRLDRDGAMKAALTDPLTGISNRAHVLQQLDVRLQELRQRQQPCGLVIIDMDHFKKINDTHGHGVGDQVLMHFAHLVEGTLRRADGFGRIGGEEFMLLLPNVSPAALTHAVDRLLDSVRAERPIASLPELKYTISAGLAMMDSIEEGVDNMRRADRALYAAKANGRDCYVWG
jgi:diguanylate cyclase (GGDEF)-like protein